MKKHDQDQILKAEKLGKRKRVMETRGLTFSLGFGLEKTKRVPEKSRVNSGLVDGSEAIQTARRGA